jgi:hypothetical protein
MLGQMERAFQRHLGMMSPVVMAAHSVTPGAGGGAGRAIDLYSSSVGRSDLLIP